MANQSQTTPNQYQAFHQMLGSIMAFINEGINHEEFSDEEVVLINAFIDTYEIYKYSAEWRKRTKKGKGA